VKREKILLTSKDVSKILDCSPDDMYALVRRGELNAVKVGKFWRYRPADVEAYVEKVKKPEGRPRQTKVHPIKICPGKSSSLGSSTFVPSTASPTMGGFKMQEGVSGLSRRVRGGSLPSDAKLWETLTSWDLYISREDQTLIIDTSEYHPGLLSLTRKDLEDILKALSK